MASQSALINYAASELAPSATDAGIAIGKYLAEAAAEKAKAWATKERPAKKRKSYKTQSARGMDRIGEPVGSSTAKWDTLDVNYTNMSPQTLNQIALLNVTKQSTNLNYDKRLKDQLNFRGIKVCMNFRCEGALGTAKAMMNVAVISPKDQNALGAIVNDDFFRDPSGLQRSAQFGSPALKQLDYYCSAINTDKYIVHKHKRMIIGPSNSTEGHKEKYISFYLPVKRQIRYKQNNSEPEGKNMFLVWWFSASDGGTPADSVRFSYRVTRYFKETVGL